MALAISGSITAQKYTLSYESQDETLDPWIQKGIEKIFKKVYPKLVKDFNPQSQKHVTIKIDTAYGGVAYAHRGAITISSAWLHKKPEDLDLVTHVFVAVRMTAVDHDSRHQAVFRKPADSRSQRVRFIVWPSHRTPTQNPVAAAVPRSRADNGAFPAHNGARFLKIDTHHNEESI